MLLRLSGSSALLIRHVAATNQTDWNETLFPFYRRALLNVSKSLKAHGLPHKFPINISLVRAVCSVAQLEPCHMVSSDIWSYSMSHPRWFNVICLALSFRLKRQCLGVFISLLDRTRQLQLLVSNVIIVIDSFFSLFRSGICFVFAVIFWAYKAQLIGADNSRGPVINFFGFAEGFRRLLFYLEFKAQLAEKANSVRL